jgi:hypothetical protein
MRRLTLYAVILLIAASCRTEWEFFKDKFEPETYRHIALDSTYTFYLRTVYLERRKKLTKEAYDSIKLDTLRQQQLTESRLKSSPGKGKKVIELEYLLVSEAYGNVIYITTTPDNSQSYYSNHRLTDSTKINADDFNTFHFGKIEDDNHLRFAKASDRHVDTWELQSPPGARELTIRRIENRQRSVFMEEVRVDEALETPFTFIRQDSFAIVMKRKDEELRQLADGKIYFRHFGTDCQQVLFSFTTVDEPGKPCVIFFSSKLVPYSAEKLVAE